MTRTFQPIRSRPVFDMRAISQESWLSKQMAGLSFKKDININAKNAAFFE